jgi:hypothetical protein
VEPNSDRETVRQSYWRRARLIIVDGMLFLTVLAFLAIGFFALKLLEVNGYPADYIEFLEKMHFVAYATLLAIFMIDLLIKVFVASIFEGRA